MNFKNSNILLDRALKSIPLASQTFSKSITQYPKGVSPLFIEKAEGSKVWDVDANKYIDFVNSLGAITIGYCDKEINHAIQDQLNKGIIFSLPNILETEVAEMLIEIIPCAEQVRFAKNGTDATSAAIRLARAYTGKEHIAVCGYHGWQDWYIGSTSKNLGVPESVQKLTHTFQYNNLQSLEKVFMDFEIAGVILEPMNIEFPENKFLERVKEITHKNNAILIFDETVTGFRIDMGGGQRLFDVTPDLAAFGKGIANGMPLSAIVGKEYIMQKMQDIFFSGTFGGELLSLASSKSVIQKYKRDQVIKHIYNLGEHLRSALNELIQINQAEDILEVKGHSSWLFLIIKSSQNYTDFQIKTLLFQEFFKRGILFIGTHNLCFAHTIDDINYLIQTYKEVVPIIKDVINRNSLEKLLNCKTLTPLFKIR